MMAQRKMTSVATLALVGALVSACVSGGPSEGPVSNAPAPTGVEGNWMSADGVAVSRLAGGVFTTTALDTGNKLADGSYKVTGSNTVEITVISLIRNTTSSVNCALVTANQLNCTSSSGQQFILTRRA